MTDPAQHLVPGGQVRGVEVTDNPALLAERRGRVQHTVVDAVSVDGRALIVIIRGYDIAARHAESVVWDTIGLPLPLEPNWRPVSLAGSRYLDVAQRAVDGHLVQVTATAALRNDRVEVAIGHLTVDGVPTFPAVAPPAVRAAVEQLLVPQSFPVPLPDAALSVRTAWFAAEGVGVQLRAGPVYVGAADARRP